MSKKQMEAQALIQKIKESSFSETEVAALHDLGKDLQEERAQIIADIDKAIAEMDWYNPNRGRLVDIKYRWEQEYGKADASKAVAVAATRAESATETKTLREIVSVSKSKTEAVRQIEREDGKINSNTPAEALKARLLLLSDLDGESGVERSNTNILFDRGSQRYIVGEMQLYNILANEIGADGAKLPALIGRLNRDLPDADKIPLTWGDSSTHETIRTKFRDALIREANRMSSISRFALGNKDASAGLLSIIRGTQKDYIESLLKNRETASKIAAELTSGSSFGWQIWETLQSIGISFSFKMLTLGLWHASIERRDIEPGSKGSPLAYVWGDSVNFTAKLRLLSAAVQGNWNDREREFITNTQSFADALTASNPEPKKDENTGKPEQRKLFEIPANLSFVKNTTERSDAAQLMQVYNDNLGALPEWASKMLIDELARLHLRAMAKADGGFDSKGLELGANLLSPSVYVALTGQYISTRVQNAGASGASYAESRVNKNNNKNNEKKTLKDLGIERREVNGKMGYVLPIAFDDMKDIEIEGLADMENGKTFLPSKDLLDFHEETVYLDDGSVATKLHILPRTGKREMVGAVTYKPQDSTADSALEKREAAKGLGGQIFAISRNERKYPKFAEIFRQIGKQNYDSAEQKLRAIKDKNNTAKQIIAVIDANQGYRDLILQAVNTYTYGGSLKNTTNVDVKTFKSMRTEKVKIAEGNISDASPRNTDAEKFFATQKNFPTKTLAEQIPGQGMSVSVYATPKGGAHRIDRYDGSIQVAGSVYDPITDPSQKEKILTRHERGIQKQLEGLNAYLKKYNAGFSMDLPTYKSILLGGALPNDLEMTKGARFFEALAAIDGNVCVNRVEGLAYPTFKLANKPGQEVSGVTSGESALIGTEKVVGTEVGMGFGFDIPGMDEVFDDVLEWFGVQSSKVKVGTGGGGNAGGKK